MIKELKIKRTVFYDEDPKPSNHPEDRTLSSTPALPKIATQVHV